MSHLRITQACNSAKPYSSPPPEPIKRTRDLEVGLAELITEVVVAAVTQTHTCPVLTRGLFLRFGFPDFDDCNPHYL